MKKYRLILFIILSLFIQLFIGCSRQSSENKTLSNNHILSSEYGSIQIEVLNSIKNANRCSVSPDETMIAIIMNRYPQILNLSDLSLVYKSNTLFPDEKFYYGKSSWSKNNNYALFSYYSLKERQGNTVFWNRSINKDINYQDFIRPQLNDSNSLLIGYRINNQSISIININSHQEINITKQTLGLPQYCKIDNFNWLNDGTVIYTVAIFNEPGKFDHTNISSLDINNLTTKILATHNKPIDYFGILSNKTEGIFSCYAENLSGSNLPGISYIVNLENGSVKEINHPMVIHSISKDSNKILCTVSIPNEGLVYGIYTKDNDKFSILTDKSNNVFPSKFDGQFINDKILLELSDQICIARL